MDNPLLVGVLHRLADRHEELETLPGRELGLVAEIQERQAVDQLHDEKGLPVRRQTAVEHLGDVGVVHERERLPFLLEPLQHGPRVHSRLDELEGDFAFHGLGLLGDPDFAHAPFADSSFKLVAPRNDDAGFCALLADGRAREHRRWINLRRDDFGDIAAKRPCI